VPSFFARVRIPPGFDPKSGSVSPKHPSFSPFANCGSHLSFCSSLPNAYIGYITRADWTLTNDRKPLSPRSNSCVTSPYSTLDIPRSHNP